MKRISGCRRWAAAVLFALTMTAGGCAVMTIDVDVYKGPMANHPETQLRQFAAYAIGVKHLLVSLRNDFEQQANRAVDQRTLPFDFVRPAAPGARAGVREGWSDGTEARYTYIDEQARLLNSVLSMYKDVGDDEARPYLAELERQWSSFRAGLRHMKYDPQLDVEVCGRVLAATRLDRGELIVAYTEFLQCGRGDRVTEHGRPRYRDALRIYRACDKTLRSNCGVRDDERTTNQAFRALTDPARVLAQVGHAFPGEPALQKEVTRRTVEIAEAFFASRESLEKLWYLAIDAIWSVHSPAFYDSARAPEDRARQEKVTTLIAPALAELTQARNLACGLAVLKKNGTIDAATAALIKSRAGRDMRPDGEWDEERYDRTVRSLEFAIRDRPADVVTLLKLVHERFKPGGASKTQAGLITVESIQTVCRVHKDEVQRMEPGSSRVFGAVRGNFANSKFTDRIDDLRGRFAAIEQSGAQGFEGGRLAYGIERLTKDYLETLRNQPTSTNTAAEHAAQDRVQKTGRALQDHLIGFAEKVVTVANHRALFPRKGPAFPQNDPVYNTGEQPGYRAAAPGTPSAGPIQRDVLLLQALGNTLTSFADELRFRTDHEARLRTRGPSERAAQERAFAVSSAQAFDTLRSELRARQKTLTAEDDTLAAELKTLTAVAQTPGGASNTSEKARLTAIVEAERKAVKDVQGQVAPAAAAYALMTPSALTDFPEFGDKGALSKFALRQKVIVMPGQTGEDYLAALHAAVKTELERYKDVPQGDGWLVALAQAQKYFSDAANAPGKGAAGAKMFDTIASNAKVKLDRNRKERADLEKRLARSEAQLATVDRADTKVTTRRQQIESRRTQVAVDLKAFQVSEKTITAQREELFKRLDAAGSDIGYDTMLTALMRVLQEARDKATGDAQKELADTYTTLAKLGTPASAGVRLRTGEGVGQESQRDALDNVRDVLANELIAAERVGLTERAEALRKAIAAANQRRADMAFIRPASAFLRNSNAATSFQSNPQVYWRNMLSEHGLRAFVPQALSENDRVVNEVRTEIDKQFWQTINTVRVAGGGKTDYVIAKDDIGNWYVKAYDSDPATIISAARSLAMFNLGGKYDMNLVRQAEISQALNDPVLSDERRKQLTDERTTLQTGSKGNVEPLDRVLKDYQAKYLDTLRSDARALGVFTDTLDTEVKGAWRAAVSTVSDAELSRLQEAVRLRLAPGLVEARANLSADSLAKQKEPEIARNVLSAMQELRRAAAIVEQEVANDVPLVSTLEGTADTAAKNLQTATARRISAENDVRRIEAAIKYEDDFLARLTDEAAQIKQRERVNDARKPLTTAQQEREKAAADEVVALKAVTDAQTAAKTARESRAALAKAGRDSVIARVRGLAERRLGEIERYNQAVMVVKGASSPGEKKP